MAYVMIGLTENYVPIGVPLSIEFARLKLSGTLYDWEIRTRKTEEKKGVGMEDKDEDKIKAAIPSLGIPGAVVLEILAKEKQLTVLQLCEKVGLGRDLIEFYLNKLREQGLIEAVFLPTSAGIKIVEALERIGEEIEEEDLRKRVKQVQVGRK